MSNTKLWKQIQLLLIVLGILPQAVSAAALFESNRGQTDGRAKYIARFGSGGNAAAFFTPQETILTTRSGATARITFPGASTTESWKLEQPAASTISYLRGADPAAWVRDVPQFERLVRRQIYPGVDLVFYSHGEELEYDLVLAPNADPGVIRLRIESADGLPRITSADGAIELRTQTGETILRQKAPHIYQAAVTPGVQKAVAGRFVHHGSEFRLQLGQYDRQQPLTVDPVLELATYLGAEGEDQITSVGTTSLGSSWVAGNTTSLTFPGLANSPRQGRDLFVRYTAPLYFGQPAAATQTVIFGGSKDDELTGVVSVCCATSPGGGDPLVFVGTTQSADFPTASIAAPGGPTSYNGGASDVFVAELDFGAVGYGYRAMLVGGTGEDRAGAVAVSGSSFVVTGTTDSPDLPVLNAPQQRLAGGKDAFVFGSNSGSLFGNTWILSYLGGSGDDFGLAAAADPLGHFAIGGETRSPDFPATGVNPGQRAGGSDGFVASLVYDTTAKAYGFSDARLIGGSGDDRVLALAYSRSAVSAGLLTPLYVAGTTNSQDFLQVQPLQAKPGGDFDGFLQRTTPATGTTDFSTYVGGSGADEIRALTLKGQDELFAAGSTQSTDLPVVAPLQAAFGGGMTDGLFLALDHRQTVQQLTYFGGSGDDSFSSLAVSVSGAIRAGGTTTSTDLPVTANAWQWLKGAGTDGLLADISTGFLSGPEHIALGKDLSTWQLIYTAAGSTNVPLTLRSSDPSKVRFNVNGVSTDHVTLAPGAWNPVAEAFADSGEVTLTASAPGYADYTTVVTLYPTGLLINASAANQTLTVTKWSLPLTVFAQVTPFDPATGAPAGLNPSAYSPRSGVDLLSNLSWTNSDPSVASIASYPDPTSNSASQQITVRDRGTTRLTVSSPLLPTVANGYLDVNVIGARLNLSPLLLGQDLTTWLPFSASNTVSAAAVPKGAMTFRSSDPAKLLLSSALTAPGQESLTVNYGSNPAPPSVYAQALASDGVVHVTISSSEFDQDYDLPVTLARTEIGLTVNARGEWTAAAGTQLGLGLTAFPEGAAQPVRVSYSARPGAAPVTVQMSVADPSIFSVTPSTTTFPAPPSGPPYLTYHAISAGTTDLTFAVDAPGYRGADPVHVVVSANPGKTSPLGAHTVGKDLQLAVVASLPSSNGLSYGADLVLSVDDPSLALLSPDANTPGQAEIHLKYFGTISFYIQGLAASGQTTFRLNTGSSSSSVPITGTVTLAPSGFAFMQATAQVSLYGPVNGLVSVKSYVLDPATALPLQTESLRVGVTAGITLSVTGPSIALDQLSATLTSGASAFTPSMTVGGLGTTTISLDTPPGFSTPAFRTSETVTVTPSVLDFSIAPMSAMKDLVMAYKPPVDHGTPSLSPIRWTSSDPSRLLLSATGQDAGSASVTTVGSAPLYLYALASDGYVPIQVEVPGLPSQQAYVTLSAVVLSLSGSLSGAQPIPAHAHDPPWTFSISPNTPGNGNLTIAGWQPGVQSDLQLTVSDPGILGVKPSTLTFKGPSGPYGLSQSGQVTFTGGAGTAQLNVTGPAGVIITPSSVVFSVTQP